MGPTRQGQRPMQGPGGVPRGMDAVQRAYGQFQQGRVRPAMKELKALLAKAPSPQAEQKGRHLYGACLVREGFHAQAAEQIGRSAEMAPRDLQVQYDWAQALQFSAQIDKSERVVRKLLKVKADYPEAIGLLASLLQSRGKHEEAVEVIDDAIGRGIGHPAIAIALAGSARRVGRETEAIERLQAVGANAALPSNVRQEAMFQCAALLDSLKQRDEAFEHYERAHGLVSATYDPRVTARDTDEMIREWTPGAIAGGAPGRDLDETPIFIVGMPRSGTTLVENILGAHPGVYAAGEQMKMATVYRVLIHKPGQGQGGGLAQGIKGLDERLVAAGAQEYLSHIKKLAPGAQRVVDKHPFNFLHLGLIAKLFPGARVIHTIRDPRDTCLSCYMRNFLNAMPYTTNQRWLGSFYREYVRLMEHWREALPGDPVGLRFMEIRYEDVIADQEGASRRLIEFAGLEWDEGVMRFHEKPRHAPTLNVDQVGRPVYASSVAKWRRYEKHIGVLLGELEPVLGGLGYADSDGSGQGGGEGQSP